MNHSVFDPVYQQSNIESKIVVAFERMSEAFKVSLWDKNRKFSLSPIQLQILTFLLFHPEELRTVSNLSKEFHTTKASISDSVKTLEIKELIRREKNTEDMRVSILQLTQKGREIAEEASDFANMIAETITDVVDNENKELLLNILLKILHKLYLDGVISIQRMCLTCSYYIKPTRNTKGLCTLLNSEIKEPDLRIDCEEHGKSDH